MGIFAAGEFDQSIRPGDVGGGHGASRRATTPCGQLRCASDGWFPRALTTFLEATAFCSGEIRGGRFLIWMGKWWGFIRGLGKTCRLNTHAGISGFVDGLGQAEGWSIRWGRLRAAAKSEGGNPGAWG